MRGQVAVRLDVTPRRGRRQRGACDHVVDVEVREHRLEVADRAAREAGGDGRPHQIGRPVAVAGGQGMAYRGRRVARRLVPRAGPPVQLLHDLRLPPAHLPAQQVPKEVVVAVALAVGVERHEQEVGALKVLERRAEPDVWSTASHRSPLIGSSTAVRVRKVSVSGGRPASMTSCR